MEFTITYKKHEIGEYTSVSKNYSIFELKLCRNLISTQTKNGSFSFLESKRKMLVLCVLNPI